MVELKNQEYMEGSQMNYVYNCNGQEKILTDDQETSVEHGSMFCVVCSECCNVPVLHMLDRKDDENES